MKVGVYSLGCKVNIYESEFVIDKLKKSNFEIVSFDEKADVYVINTCSVTNEADRKSRQIINRARKNNKDAIIVVMGCYSQTNSDKIDADIIIGNKDKSKIVELIRKNMETKRRIKNIYNLQNVDDFEGMEISNFDNHTRAFVKIQDGCNAFCSYCIIPFVRGKIRSKDMGSVIREVNDLVCNGYREIVLTGIHTGKYGLEIKNVNLEKLLRELVKIDGIYRIRLSSIEINEITDGILELMKDNKIMASHLHIPLQSGSDKILKLMNRKYDVNYFKERINVIRKIRDDISITTDLIVGFPGEEVEDFEDTMKTLEEINFTKIHVFPYSVREGTKASMMEMQVSKEIKKERVKKVLELSNKCEINFYKKFIGDVMEGVCEVRDDYTVVHTSNFIPVIINDKVRNKTVIKVQLKEIVGNKVMGEIVY